jgi:poly-gamma-glutamate capsule biosynthesis protein CapA/YwtB (metallophosphatase superfamily)
MPQDTSSKAPKRAKARRKAVAALASAPAQPLAVESIDERSEARLELATVHPLIAEDGASLEAEQVQLRLTAVGRVEAGGLSVTQGAVAAARAEHLTADRSALGVVLADRAEISRSYTRSIVARQVQLDRAAARVVIAADVNAQQTAVMFLVARRVASEVRVLFDWRGALAFGAGAGLVFALLSRLRRRPR